VASSPSGTADDFLKGDQLHWLPSSQLPLVLLRPLHSMPEIMQWLADAIWGFHSGAPALIGSPMIAPNQS
jgi:hypothetical protein